MEYTEMKKDYMDFVEEIRTDILEFTGGATETVYFESEGGVHGFSKDRLVVVMYEMEGEQEVMALYISELYDEYKKGTALEELKRQIRRDFRNAGQYPCLQETRRLKRFEEAESRLVIRTRNVCDPGLEYSIYHQIGDIALVVYFVAGYTEGNMSSLKVRKEYAGLWEMEEEDIWKAALENTVKRVQPVFYRFEKLLTDPECKGEEFMGDPEFRLNGGRYGDCLSTDIRTNGAAAIFFPGVAEQIGELLHDDVYLVFTSIHEVMVHPKSWVEPEELQEALEKTIEKSTPKEEILTRHIYRYSREERKFYMC